ncbi:MAG: DUF1572 domain-containing protein [Acidobacteria bacterium]|nr:DUF1572 domain-containing protein [Acidobacteriota bacterium]
MWTQYLSAIITRELRALSREIRSFPDDEALWHTPPGAANSAGNLALHLAGNIRHYIGARLGGTGYLRDRAAEFSRSGLSREELARQVEDAIAAVEQHLPALTSEALEADFPEAVGGNTVRTAEFLLHLVAHLAYHLGQMDYHRRIVTGQPVTIGAVAVKELSTAR